MKPIFEIIMKLKEGSISPITRLTYRIEGLGRNEAILLAESLAGNDYSVYYVLNGPRNEVN